MSLAGTGNAVAGSLLADGIKNMFAAEQNKAATKGDLKKLKEELLGRYFPITNLPFNEFGQHPFYDIITHEVVYLEMNLFSGEFRLG